jgi:hypothetical protein
MPNSPDPTSPIDPKESTEAKLCAYLEGELSPAERAEIEQHLSANPQHRQLLFDLAKTREWMRSIPSETSPVDLAEIFQGQNERSMLLDDPNADRSTLTTRWPQAAMLAAVVLLTVGLGVLVVAMLKGPKNGSSKTFSLGPATAASAPSVTSSVGSASTFPTELATAGKDGVSSVSGAKQTDQAPAGGVAADMPSVAMAAGGGSTAEMKTFAAAAMPAQQSSPMSPISLMHRDQPDTDLAGRIKSKLGEAGYPLPTDEKSVGFVVTASSPANSVEQLQGFFNRHQLAYDDALAGKTSVAQLDKLTRETAVTQPVAGLAFANAQSAQSAQNGQIAQNARLQQLRTITPITNAINAALPTTEPADQAIYVSRHLTALQLELLSASLETDSQNQSVRRVTLSEPGGEAQPPASPLPVATGGIEKGQTLSVTVAELVGPGIDKTNVVKVADDGTISLPMIDPIAAAGASTADLQKRIADKYKEANLIPQATVTIASAAATTQPASQQGFTTTPPTTATVTVPMPALTPVQATQPIAAATEPVQPGISVVVLIEKPPAAVPGK